MINKWEYQKTDEKKKLIIPWGITEKENKQFLRDYYEFSI